MFREDSDYDLAILSKTELTIDQLNEIALKISKEMKILADKVDIIDLNKASNDLIYKVIRDGKPLYVADYNFLRRWIRSNYIRVLDEEDLMDIFYKRLRRKIKETLKTHWLWFM